MGLLALLASVLATGCAPMSFLVTPVPRSPKLVEKVIERDGIFARDRIALIDVSGVLRNARDQSLLGPAGENPVAIFKEKLDKAAADKRVKAVVLRINSPGGGVTASDLMYTELTEFRERTDKPVVAVGLDVMASGAYYLACGADRIVVTPTSVVGSIGVILILPEFSGTMQKLGIRANVIKSGEMKDAGSPFRTLQPAEREIFQEMIDAMYARFVSVVQSSRTDMEETRLRELADGRVYLAPDAVASGLVDEIGTLHDGVELAKQLAGLDDKPIVLVQYGKVYDYRPNIYADTPAGPAQVNVVNVDLPEWLEGPGARFMYLWAPGW